MATVGGHDMEGIMTHEDKFKSTCIGAVVFCVAVLISAFVIAKALPTESEKQPVTLPKDNVVSDSEDDITDDFGARLTRANYDVEGTYIDDIGLLLYRSAKSKQAVEWFYNHITGDKTITNAILTEADNNDIPLSLAFALAFTESRFQPSAKNINTNHSIDRGLFQLNNRSFPQIRERDFFNPVISAKYGMQHLRYCLRITGGNTALALATYNAGQTKVTNNKTPQTTVAYIGKIFGYREKLERLFAKEVTPYFDSKQDLQGINVAYMEDDRK